MSSRFRIFARRFVFATNAIIAVTYLLACLAPYLNPVKWWFISWLGLIFPFLFFVLGFSLLFWIFFRRKYAIIIFIVLLFGWKNLVVFFGFNIPHSFRLQKNPGEIRVVSWNVARFVEIKKNNNKGSQARLKIMEQLKQQNADVLCLQEFHTSTKEDYYDNITYIQKELNYPYYYFSWDTDGDKLYYSSIIFSRHRIIDSGIVLYPRPALPEALLHADIVFNNDTIRIFTSHLQSVQFRKVDYTKIENIKSYEDSLIPNSKSIFSKVKKGISYRSYQSRLLKQTIDASPYPVILAADFNDTPNSYTYFTIAKNMKDAFLKKGFAIGRTFSSLSPTLRIDYILTSKKFSVKQFNRIISNYSDHYMIVADLKLPEH
jgi:endonuclease/exonuclease/phosphatase family metal-dependent hydrolase